MNHFKEDPKLAILSRQSKSRLKTTKRNHPVLFLAEASDPDMLYFSWFQAFDPYLAFSVDGKRFAVTHEMEYGRMVKESAFDEILLLNEVREGAAKRFNLPKDKVPDNAQMVLHLAELHGIPNFKVADRFPSGRSRRRPR